MTAEAIESGEWAPSLGEFSTLYFDKLERDGGLEIGDLDHLRSESLDILSRCVDPRGDDQINAGLVIGHVQSGKTMSFTTVSALARDNGYELIILLAGTTNELRKQSARRLKNDLTIRRHAHHWKIYDRPEGDTFADLRKRLAEKSTANPFNHETIIVSVLKNYQRINTLADELRFVAMSGIPTLIIDDEADQASLNTLAASNLKDHREHDDEVSRTYESIENLRGALPLHTFLEYTATPQAVMLLTIIDRLSPDWAVTLTPGRGYTGGRTFFVEQKDQIIRTVPTMEIFDPYSPPAELPDSLALALETFVLTCAQHRAGREDGNRTMMIQPHNWRDPHRHYAMLAMRALSGYTAFKSDPSALTTQFEAAYDDLASTTPHLSPLTELIDLVPQTAETIQLRVVNSDSLTDDVDFESDPYNLLIGGMLLDRGFTVEGLTVTYMPRLPKTGADTMQQRARFFGYRGKHLHYCRVYLPDALSEAFESYVRTEEALRADIQDHQHEPLQSWRRFLQQPANVDRLVRQSVISLDVYSRADAAGWEWPKHLHEHAEENSPKFDSFHANLLANRGFSPATDIPGVVDNRPNRPNDQWFSDVPAADVITLLRSLQVSDPDRIAMRKIIDALERVNPPLIDVIALDGLSTEREQFGRRLRVLQDNPFRGRSTTSEAYEYVSERDVRRHDTRSTLQLRRVTLSDFDRHEAHWFAINFATGTSVTTWHQM